MTSTLRNATDADVSRIVELITSARLPARFVDEFLDGFVVAERGGEIVGCGGLEQYEDAGVLRSFVVDESARGRGIGRRLGEEAIRLAGERGIRKLYLFTLDSAPFWQRLGFADASLEDWRAPARACWQYRYVSTHRGEFPGIHSMRRLLT